MRYRGSASGGLGFFVSRHCEAIEPGADLRHSRPHRTASAHRGPSFSTVSSDEVSQVKAGSRVGGYTSTTVGRSGPAIRAALVAHAPERRARFEAELRSALAGAAENLDLAGPQAVLARWHVLATMAANPLTDEERAQIERAKAGDYTGLSIRDENGNWVRL